MHPQPGLSNGTPHGLSFEKDDRTGQKEMLLTLEPHQMACGFVAILRLAEHVIPERQNLIRTDHDGLGPFVRDLERFHFTQGISDLPRGGPFCQKRRANRILIDSRRHGLVGDSDRI
jgi:hypothetical protein